MFQLPKPHQVLRLQVELRPAMYTHVQCWCMCMPVGMKTLCDQSSSRAGITHAQEGNVSLAAITSDPFIDCYRAWLKERAYSSGTAADFLRSFARTSGDAEIALLQRADGCCTWLGS